MSKYTIDRAHSGISFSVRHMMFAKVRGRFAKWDAEIEHDPLDLTKTRICATADASSIDTYQGLRDAHLRSSNFLDVASHHTLVFESRHVAAGSDKHYAVTGDLTLRGVTKSIVIDVEEVSLGQDPIGKERVRFSARGVLDRRDFGIVWNQILEAGGILIGELVEVEIDVQATEV